MPEQPAGGTHRASPGELYTVTSCFAAHATPHELAVSDPITALQDQGSNAASVLEASLALTLHGCTAIGLFLLLPPGHHATAVLIC